jgi:hypothetical protein
MAEQPVNATISVFRHVRAQRQEIRHDAVKPITGRMRSLVVIVPSREILVDETRDAVVSDFFQFGHPIVRYLRPVTTVATVRAGVAGLQMPIRIGRDQFIVKDQAHRTEDLHANVREAAGLTNVVDGV